jgi:hypothetical protein
VTKAPFLLLAIAALAACAEGVADSSSASVLATNPKDSGATESAEPRSPDASSGGPEEPADAGTGASVDAEIDAAIDSGIDASVDAPPTSVDAGPAPVVDGVIGANEYGGQNQMVASGSSTTWYLTWTDTNLHVAVSDANVAEGLVLYLDSNPSGADGSVAGATYDATRVALPFHADFVAYVKSSYQEYRVADGAGGWSAATTTGISLAGSGNVREIVIAWSTISGGRPASFSWLGYVTSSSGYVYGAMPPSNPGGNIGLGASFTSFYRVTDATPAIGSKPFSLLGP